MKEILFIFASLVFVSAAWAGGPYGFPDTISCALNDPQKPGYSSAYLKIRFPHVEEGSNAQHSRKATIEVHRSSDSQNFTIEHTDVHITFAYKPADSRLVEIRTVLVMLDGVPLFIIANDSGKTHLTPIGIDQTVLPLASTSSGCLYLDGTGARPGLSGSNRSRQ